MISLPSVNRDEQRFPDGDGFELDRDPASGPRRLRLGAASMPRVWPSRT